MRLARRTGVPIGELQARWTAREFAELCAFDAIEPDDATRLEHALVALVSVVAQLAGAKLEAAALVPDYWGERAAAGRRRQSPREVAAIAALYAQFHNQTAAGRGRGAA